MAVALAEVHLHTSLPPITCPCREAGCRRSVHHHLQQVLQAPRVTLTLLQVAVGGCGATRGGVTLVMDTASSRHYSSTPTTSWIEVLLHPTSSSSLKLT